MVQNCMRGNVNEQNCSCLVFACGRFAWRTALYLCNVALARSRAHKGCAVGAEARGSTVKMTDALGQVFSSLILLRFEDLWTCLHLEVCITSNGPGRKLAQRMRALNLVREEMSYWESKYFSLVCKL